MDKADREIDGILFVRDMAGHILVGLTLNWIECQRAIKSEIRGKNA